MADEEGYESFEVSDYDLDAALNPGKRRRMTKEQRIYGMWAAREDSDEEGYYGFGKSSKSATKRPDYSAQVNFVKGGVKIGDRVMQKKDIKVDAEGDDDIIIEEKMMEKFDYEDEILPVFEKKTSRIEVDYRKSGKSAKSTRENDMSFAGLRGLAQSGQREGVSWQKHSKGEIVMRMMEKMGYKHGQGLGAQSQGIVEPIEAVKRPGRAAVGAYGQETKGPKFGESASEAQKREESGQHSENDEQDIYGGAAKEEQLRLRQKHMWKRAQKTPKYRYRTVEEVIADGGQLKKRLGTVGTNNSKVIDMTGREQRIYSGYDSFLTKTKLPDVEPERKAFDMPELMFNLNVLIDTTEEEIVRTDRQLKFLTDQSISLTRDKAELEQSLVKEQQQQDRTAKVLQLIEIFLQKSNSGELDLDECETILKRLKSDFYEEYVMFDLPTAVCTSSVLPLMKDYFSCWVPLLEGNTEYGLEMMRSWKLLLSDAKQSHLVDQTSKFDSTLNPYDLLLWEAWMPRVRKATLDWNPRQDFETILHLIDSWLSLLPKWIAENLLEHVVLPKILDKVENWDPMSDTVPIHCWLHPWLPLMGDRLQPVYAPIRQKLGKALSKWRPADASAKLILRPWKDVFSPGTMDSFLARHIVPKLDESLHEMSIDPANQQLTTWHDVMQWSDVMLSADTMAQILLRSFFPRWQETLCIWLDAPQAQFHEIAEWYEGWKSRMPESVQQIAQIREQFAMALNAMKRASSGYKVGKPAAAFGPNPNPMPSIRPPFINVQARPQAPYSFKDLVERRAAERGVKFVPQIDRYREGRPLYWFGRIQIYLDKNVLFAQDPVTGIWAPIGLDSLISICN